MAHWLIMWGCIIAAAITFPLVWGWIHFETVPGNMYMYRTFVFGFAVQDFPVASFTAFIVFHGLVWASFLVIAGVMLAFRRRMIDHGARGGSAVRRRHPATAAALRDQRHRLMLTASYTWMQGYAYDFLAILHAITVIFTLLWLPFGKFFHIFQRPAQLGVSFYKDVGRAIGAGDVPPLRAAVRVGDDGPRSDATVEQQLGFTYEMTTTAGALPAGLSEVPACMFFGTCAMRGWGTVASAMINSKHEKSDAWRRFPPTS